MNEWLIKINFQLRVLTSCILNWSWVRLCGEILTKLSQKQKKEEKSQKKITIISCRWDIFLILIPSAILRPLRFISEPPVVSSYAGCGPLILHPFKLQVKCMSITSDVISLLPCNYIPGDNRKHHCRSAWLHLLPPHHFLQVNPEHVNPLRPIPPLFLLPLSSFATDSFPII